MSSQPCLAAGMGNSAPYAPCDPSPRVAVSSSMIVIFAREIAQAVLVPVNLVEGKKLMGENLSCHAVCAERAMFQEELFLKLTRRHFFPFKWGCPHDLLARLPLRRLCNYFKPPQSRRAPLYSGRSRDMRVGESLRNIGMICVVTSYPGAAKSISDANAVRWKCIWMLREVGRGPRRVPGTCSKKC